jgi:mannan endo-1,4-beta-mannosidase
MSFAHLASGGAGSGMRWPYTRPHHLLPEMRDNLLGLARFAAAVDWTNFDSRNISEQVKVSDEHVIKAACADEQTAIIWLLRNRKTTASLEGLEVEVDGVLNDGAYMVDLWETYQGCEYARLVVMVHDGKLKFTVRLNGLALGDIAIHVRAITH